MQRIICIILLFVVHYNSKAQIIEGIVIDSNSKEALPYANVSSNSGQSGTMTNSEGFFSFSVKKQNSNEAITISFIGYKNKIIPISDFKNSPLEIQLEPVKINLKEVIIRPLSPEEYLKLAIRNFANSRPSKDYYATAYYREKFMENDHFVALNEGIFKINRIFKSDTSLTQFQLCLYRTADEKKTFNS